MIRWNILLQNRGVLNRREPIVLWNVANVYDSNRASVKDAYSDTLAFYLAAVSDLGYKQKLLVNEIHRCEHLADAVGNLANDLAIAAGSDTDASRNAREQFYFRIDQPFRRWLLSLDPDWEEDEIDESLDRWERQAQQIAYEMGRRLAEAAGPAAFVGRSVKEEKKGKKEEQAVYYASPKAYNRFLKKVRTIYSKEGGV